MKLQHKAWVLILIVVAVCAGAAMLGARYVVLYSYDRLEADRAATEGERARRVLEQQVEALSATARDYAFWDDAADFVIGRRPAFLVENFGTENLGYLGVSELLVVDRQGRPLATVAQDNEALTEIPAERVGPLRDLALPLLAGGDVKAVVRTARMVGDQLEFVVGAVVHRPDAENPVAEGAMLMVRRMGSAELARLSDVLMVPVRLEPFHPRHGVRPTHLEPGDDLHNDLHTVLLDHQGQPVVELVLSLDRKLQQQADALAWSGMLLVGLAGGVASLLLVGLLDRLLLRRLQNLHDDLKAVTLGSLEGSAGVRILGNDELSALGQGINQLLDRVRRDALAQREAHAQQEALQMQLLQSQKIEALGRFTGGIAHDFNNSLAAITGWMKVAVDDLDPEHPSQEALQQALKATRYADGLMRQLLAYSRQSTPRMERLRVTRLIEDARNLVASGLVRHSRIEVRVLTEDDWVQADPTQLQQVLVNLLMNAADAMEGEGTVHLELDAFALKAGQPLPGRP
ncbi:MAG: CHASE4 domain-containing protein, partial [Hydrogenophaga sp.]